MFVCLLTFPSDNRAIGTSYGWSLLKANILNGVRPTLPSAYVVVIIIIIIKIFIFLYGEKGRVVKDVQNPPNKHAETTVKARVS